MEPVTMEGCKSLELSADPLPFTKSYFKPAPSWDKNTCTLQNLAVEDVVVQGNIDHQDLKQTASLEACKQLHEIGALTDNLVQDIVVEEADSQESGNEPCTDEQPSYFPPELVGHFPMDSDMKYHCYLIELKQNFAYDVPVHDVVLIMRKELESDAVSMSFDLDADRGSLTVNFKYVGAIDLSIAQVLLCRRFQITLLRVLIDHNLKDLKKPFGGGDFSGDEIDYLLLPATGKHMTPLIIDWECVVSVNFSCEKLHEYQWNCRLPEGYAHHVQTKDGPVCTCMLHNSLVSTPHNGHVYCITGSLGFLKHGRAILVDSGYNTKKVFQSIRRLLEPLVTPETMPSHPAKELKEICQKEHYIMKDPIKSHDRVFTSVTIEVEAKGLSFKHTATAAAETTANKVACQQVLKSLKDSALDSKS